MEERFPSGEFQFDGEISKNVLEDWINQIEDLPELLEDAVKDLNEEQLDTSYRSEGWTVDKWFIILRIVI